MAGVELTADRQIAALRPAATRYEAVVGGSHGLVIRVSPSGAKQFAYRYRLPSGRRRRLVLGLYPDLTLASARIRAAEVRLSLVNGADPVGEKAAARERARSGETLDELAEAYWAAARVGLHGGRRRPKRPGTIDNERQLWRNHIRKPLGGRPLMEIKRADVKSFMRDRVTSGLSAASVASIGGLLHAVMGYAVLEERLEANPVHGLARPLALTSRERMFDDVALTALWASAILASEPWEAGAKKAGVHARLEPAMGLAIQLLMLTLTRRNEAAGARKSEFDRKARIWTIPSSRAKARHPHVVPFDDACLAVIDKAWALDPDSPYLFPSARSPGQHLDPHAITRAFARTCARKKLPLGSPHDVRRSGATTLTGQYGVSRFIAGLVLGHTPNEGAAVTAVYDRYTYVPEKREALSRWGRHLRGEPEEKDAGGLAAVSGAPADEQEELERAKAAARVLCEEASLQQAVLSLTLSLARRPEGSVPHLDLLAKAGLDIAAAGSKAGVARWIDGFR